MSEFLYAPFDTETGGTNEKESDILTFYMAIVDGSYKIIDELDLKLKPDGGRLPIAHADALKVNKIDLQKHLADPTTVTYSEGRKRLAEMLGRHHKKIGKVNNIKPMGYNVPFDENFTWEHLMPKAEWQRFMHYKRVDVMERVDFLKEAGWFPNDLGSLGTVANYLQVPKREAHIAREDILMTIDVYKKLLEIMKSKKDGGTSQDLISLLEAE